MPLFSDLLKAAGSAFDTAVKKGGKEARDWYRQTAQTVKGVNANDIMRSDPSRLLMSNRLDKSSIGRMVMFFYNPKTKKDLPYYDRFPLIFPIGPSQTVKGAFLGINLHYLPYFARARLMDALYVTANSPRTKEQRLRISYDILVSSTRFALFRPCLKMYLYTHVASRFFVVKPEEWDMVLCLPVERFESGGKGGGIVGANVSKARVWAESMRQVRARW